MPGHLVTADSTAEAAQWLQQQVFYVNDKNLMQSIRQRHPIFLLDAQAQQLHGVFQRTLDAQQLMQDLTQAPAQRGYQVSSLMSACDKGKPIGGTPSISCQCDQHDAGYIWGPHSTPLHVKGRVLHVLPAVLLTWDFYLFVCLQVHVVPLYAFPVAVNLESVEDLLVPQQEQQQQGLPGSSSSTVSYEPMLGSFQHGALWEAFMKQAKKHLKAMESIDEEQQQPPPPPPPPRPAVAAAAANGHS
jgi:hypothetical protein